MRNGLVTKYDSQGNLIRGQVDMPPQYLRGWVEFYKLKFKVTPDVLIPRPETELLIDEVIQFAGSMESSPTVLDIGTGSGCIAISIAKNLPKARVFAVDISEPALDVARENTKKNRAEGKIFFLKSDLLSVIPTNVEGSQTSEPEENGRILKAKFIVPDIMVANLPYIPSSRIFYLDPSVKDFEPRLALDGGSDGFNLYRRLFKEMKEKNLIPKLFIGEIDEAQDKIAVSEARKYFSSANIEIKNDLAKKPRILIIASG